MIARPAVALGSLLAATSALVAANAHATLLADAERVASVWTTEGQTVERRAPIFLELTRLRRIDLGKDDAGDGCTTLAVIGPRGADFFVRVAPQQPSLGPVVSKPERATAGIAFVSRCGDDRRDFGETIVDMRSPRAALEIVIARGAIPASIPSESALVDRFVAPQRPPMDPGRAVSQEAIADRAARVELRARGDGATALTTKVTDANDDGQGRVFFGLQEGCHRIELLSELGAGGRIPDLDAELRDATTNATMARDRSDTSDARLDICAGESGPVLVTFGGAPSGAKIAVMDARWPFPAGIPATWGPRPRGAIATGLLKRHAPKLSSPPIASSLGVSGTTNVPIDLEPGSCYLATVASMRGDPKQLTLSTQIEGRSVRDDGGHARDGSTIAFCSRKTERGAIRVEARGPSLSWVLSIWNVGPAGTEDDDS